MNFYYKEVFQEDALIIQIVSFIVIVVVVVVVVIVVVVAVAVVVYVAWSFESLNLLAMRRSV